MLHDCLNISGTKNTTQFIRRLIHTAMRAIRVKSFGNPEVLQIDTNAQIPSINDNQVSNTQILYPYFVHNKF